MSPLVDILVVGDLGDALTPAELVETPSARDVAIAAVALQAECGFLHRDQAHAGWIYDTAVAVVAVARLSGMSLEDIVNDPGRAIERARGEWSLRPHLEALPVEVA